MDKDKVLDKIKKCLALGQSANEHEAAQAIKQAQALMRQYGISDDDVALSVVTEAGVGCALGLPTWHQLLIGQCAKAFGVECYQQQFGGLAEVRFFGVGIKPELAAYAYEVLLRQLKKARREYLKNELKLVRLAKNKTYRADQFCTGWVYAVSQKVVEFAIPAGEKVVIEKYRTRMGEMRQAKKRDARGGYSSRGAAAQDLVAGIRLGREAQLHHAMDGGEKHKRLEAI